MAKVYDFPCTQTQKVAFKTLTTADTSLTAPTTASQIIMTAGPEGLKVDAIKARAVGTNVASLLRVFLNDGLGVAAANFSLIHEEVLPLSALSQTAVEAAAITLFPINYDNAGGGVLPPYLAPGQKLYVSLGTAVAAGWVVTGFGGDY